MRSIQEGHPSWTVREGSLLGQEIAWQEKGIRADRPASPMGPIWVFQGISDGPVPYQGPGNITTVGQGEWWAFEDRWPDPWDTEALVSTELRGWHWKLSLGVRSCVGRWGAAA